jgi:hypothetical protein
MKINLYKVLLMLMFLSAKNLTAQDRIPYYDAMALKKLFSLHQKENPPTKIPVDANVSKLLQFYFPNSADIEADIQANALLRPFFSVGGNASLHSAAVLGFSSLSGSIDNLDVTNLADGFAKFLVKRTKQELNVAFFSKFSDLISKDEYKDARILFPQTFNLLNAIGSQIYNYEAYINALKEAFEKDLNSLLPNLEKVIKDGRYKTFFNANPELKAICLSSIFVGEGLLSKEHVGKIIADFPVDSIFVGGDLTNANGAMKTLQLFSESIRSKSSSHYWVGFDSLKILLADPVATKIFLGLLYQWAEIKNPPITFSGGVKLTDELAKPENLSQIISFFYSFQNQADIVSNAIKNISGKEADKVTFTDYYALYNSSVDLISKVIEIQSIPSLKPLFSGNAASQKALGIARQGSDIALDINRKNYSSAIIGLFQLYTVYVEDQTQGKVKSFILKYGSFMAAIAQANSSDDVEAAIEAVALPSGSSRIKRETPFNVSLNGYTGLFYGREQIDGVTNTGSYFNSYGVSAPIGISISRGHSFLFLGTGKKGWKENKYGWSSTLFLSVVDIGALASFRFTNDSTQTVPNIQLKDIISPGVFYSIGIPKSPLSFSCGYQLGPLLREVTQTKNSYSQNYTRFSISLCVDIPLLNFYTKSKDN